MDTRRAGEVLAGMYGFDSPATAVGFLLGFAGLRLEDP